MQLAGSLTLVIGPRINPYDFRCKNSLGKDPQSIPLQPEGVVDGPPSRADQLPATTRLLVEDPAQHYARRVVYGWQVDVLAVVALRPRLVGCVLLLCCQRIS